MDSISTTPQRFEWLTERLNPVLIKEVRQALRGASFRNVYLVTLILIGVAGTTVLLNLGVDNDSGGGLTFGQTVVGCLCVGLIGLVPLVAFQSVSAEWEEDTHDLLILTDLSPFQVIFGKLLSCAVQILLMLAAFAPVVAVGLVLQGLDPLAVLFLTLYLPVVSLGLCCISMAVAAHCRMRMIRVMAMGLVALGLALTTMGMIGFQGELLRNPDEIQDWQFVGALGIASLAAITFSALAFCAAMVRFTHEEDNSSTPSRLVLMTGALGSLFFGFVIYGRGGFDSDELAAVLVGFFIFSYPAFLAFATEPRGLGRRTALRLEGKRWALLRMPFLPGCDRGVLYLLSLGLAMTVLLWIFAAVIAPARVASGVLSPSDDPFTPLATVVTCVAYTMIYVGLPALVLRPFCKTASGRWRVRLLCITFLLAGIMIPMAVGMVVEDRALGQGRHALNPFWALNRVVDGSGGLHSEVLPMLLAAAAITLVYLARLPKAYGEVSAAVRGRVSLLPGEAPPGEPIGA